MADTTQYLRNRRAAYDELARTEVAANLALDLNDREAFEASAREHHALRIVLDA
jgi:hypothetical protein